MCRDEDLMSEAARGDLAAFEKLVRRHQNSAWNVAFRLLGNAADAEDLAQEAFLRILRAAPRYQPKASFRTYLYRILTRLCRDHWRRRSSVPWPDPDSHISRGPTPEECAATEEERHTVQQAIASLPTRQREAIVLRYYEQLSYDDISDVLGSSRKAVERLLARGRAALGERLRGPLAK